jgi:hypothetical protein
MENQYIHVSEVTPNILTQKHVKAGFAMVKYGLSTERPAEGNAQLILWFSTDTYKLAYWTGTAWIESAAFS